MGARGTRHAGPRGSRLPGSAHGTPGGWLGEHLFIRLPLLHLGVPSPPSPALPDSGMPCSQRVPARCCGPLLGTPISSELGLFCCRAAWRQPPSRDSAVHEAAAKPACRPAGHSCPLQGCVRPAPDPRRPSRATTDSQQPLGGAHVTDERTEVRRGPRRCRGTAHSRRDGVAPRVLSCATSKCLGRNASRATALLQTRHFSLFSCIFMKHFQIGKHGNIF